MFASKSPAIRSSRPIGGPGPTARQTDRLTERERQCLRLVHRGFESKEIAGQLGISTDRVNKLTGSAKRKLGVSRRTIAARMLAEEEQPASPEPLPTHSLGGMPMGVAASPAVTLDGHTDEAGGAEQEGEAPSDRLSLMATDRPSLSMAAPLPLRGVRRLFNDLDRRSTLVAIAMIAMAATAAAGAGASLLLVLNWLQAAR